MNFLSLSRKDHIDDILNVTKQHFLLYSSATSKGLAASYPEDKITF